MFEKILERLLGERGVARKYALVETSRLGVSGANVVILSKDDQLFVLKWDDSNAARSIVRQMSARNELAQLYGEHHLPQVIAHNPKAMLMAYAGESLSSMVAKHRLSVSELNHRIRILYGKVGSVWAQHNKPCKRSDLKHLPRKPLERWRRIQRAALKTTLQGVLLRRFQDLPIVINDAAFPPLSKLFRSVQRVYVPPRRLVLCHGDMTGDNILLDRTADNAWQLIDPAWYGWHDWRVAVSFMGEWWRANHVTVKHATIGVEAKRIVIRYDVEVPAATELIATRALELAERIGTNELFSEPSWREQLQLQAAILFFGDLRFIAERELSPDHGVALLAKGIETLAPLL